MMALPIIHLLTGPNDVLSFTLVSWISRILITFIVGKQNGSTINELKDLQHLQGTLSISNLQNGISSRDALEANLRGKKSLKELSLNWDHDGVADSQMERYILDSLQPQKNLERLVIQNYRGTRFSDWVGDCSFSSLRFLQLKSVRSCFSLPPLAQLPSLKKLHVSGFDSLVTVGAEFFDIASSAVSPFRSLEVLVFEDMTAWEEWICFEGAFPCLKKLYLKNCPKLRKTLPHHLPSLRKFKIESCGQLGSPIPQTPSICVMELMDSDKLLLTELPKELKIIKLSGCNATDSLLQVLSKANASLESLSVTASMYLTSLSSCGLRSIDVMGCKSLRSFPLDFFPKLVILRIYDCEKLESLCVSVGPLPYLMSLESMVILNCPEFVSFPGGGISAPNLKSFHLMGCRNLKSLPQHMHSLFPSLKDLTTQDCGEVESFPGGGFAFELRHSLDLWMQQTHQWLETMGSAKSSFS